MYFNSDYDAALPHVERALQVAETQGLWDVLCPALDTKGIILAARGRRAEAEVLIRGGLAVALEHGLTQRASVSSISLATTLEEDDRLESALEIYSQTEEILRRLGDRPRTAGTRLNRMQGLIELGRWDEAEAIFNEYLEADAAELGSLVWPGAQAVNAAWLYLLRGDIAAGRRLVEEGAPLVAHAQLEMRVQHEAARAAVANAEGDHVGALTTGGGHTARLRRRDVSRRHAGRAHRGCRSRIRTRPGRQGRRADAAGARALPPRTPAVSRRAHAALGGSPGGCAR